LQEDIESNAASYDQASNSVLASFCYTSKQSRGDLPEHRGFSLTGYFGFDPKLN
jgi:hypothetical protein